MGVDLEDLGAKMKSAVAHSSLDGAVGAVVGREMVTKLQRRVSELAVTHITHRLFADVHEFAKVTIIYRIIFCSFESHGCI